MLQHVTLEVRPADVDACLAFWSRLGFEQVVPPPLLRDRFVWVQRGDTQIHMMPVDDPVTTRRGHAAVVVDDYEGTLRSLREQGSDPQPGEDAWDAPRSFVRDPAGNLVEVMSAPPLPPWPGEPAPAPG
jgi:catechol 2,3-dioxygenase-like lactoylglutathione lyase family enzyme